jgi:hypothetical protein
MPKNPLPIAYDIKPARPPSKLARITFMILVFVVLAPLVMEGAVTCYAQWCDVMGRSTEVKTPIINWIGRGLGDVHDQLADRIGPTFHSSVRDPKVALPVAGFLILAAMMMLKR